MFTRCGFRVWSTDDQHYTLTRRSKGRDIPYAYIQAIGTGKDKRFHIVRDNGLPEDSGHHSLSAACNVVANSTPRFTLADADMVAMIPVYHMIGDNDRAVIKREKEEREVRKVARDKAKEERDNLQRQLAELQALLASAQSDATDAPTLNA